jgi:hypothetical protein
MPRYCDVFERKARGASPSAMKWGATASKAKGKAASKSCCNYLVPLFWLFEAWCHVPVTRSLKSKRLRTQFVQHFRLIFLLTGDYVVENLCSNFFSLCMYVQHLFRATKRSKCLSIIKNKLWLLFRRIIVFVVKVIWNTQMESVNKAQWLLMLQHQMHVVTTQL